MNMPMEVMLYTQNLTDSEKIQFIAEYQSQRKDTTTAVLLALFLGGIGVHHFYMGKVLLGVIYLLFFWTFIPAFIALIEAILMSNTVRSYNDARAQEIAGRITMMRNGNGAPAGQWNSSSQNYGQPIGQNQPVVTQPSREPERSRDDEWKRASDNFV